MSSFFEKRQSLLKTIGNEMAIFGIPQNHMPFREIELSFGLVDTKMNSNSHFKTGTMRMRKQQRRSERSLYQSEWEMAPAGMFSEKFSYVSIFGMFFSCNACLV